MSTIIHVELDTLCFLILAVIAYQITRSVSKQMNRVLFRTLVYGIMFSLALDIIWVLTEGRIEEVRLDVYEDSGEAATSARVTWELRDGTPQTGSLTVSHWEGEADEESRKLWQEQAAEFTGSLVPIFYSADNPEKFIGYIEDSQKM